MSERSYSTRRTFAKFDTAHPGVIADRHDHLECSQYKLERAVLTAWRLDLTGNRVQEDLARLASNVGRARLGQRGL